MATNSPPNMGPRSYASRRWSGESVLADYRELQASAMGLSHHDHGQFALLGGRKYLALVDLSDPKNVSNKVVRNVGKWEVTTVQWAPVLPNRIAIAANDRIEVVNPENDLNQEQILKSHTRYISDIDWNPKEPFILASGSHDAYLNIWDLRSTGGHRQRPALTFNMIVSASQVKWNKLSTSVIATSHEGDVKLWDTRKASAPIMYLTAHMARIYSLDWSPHCKDQLVTSSQDCFVKFFNFASSKPSKPLSSLKTAVPVWKAKYTPFGDGLGTVIVPHMQRYDHSLFLWNYKHLDFPVHSFFGHKDVILDFDWRRNGPDDLQMVTWSKDHTLRLWTVEPTTQYQCGVDPSEDNSGANSSDEDVAEEAIEAIHDLEEERASMLDEASCDTSEYNYHTRDSTPSKTLTNNTLQQEFELLSLNLGSVKAEGLNTGKRSIKFTATVAANQAIHRVCLVVHFPVDYPSENAPPSFVFAKGTTLDPQARSNILKALRQTASEKVREKSPCLNPCLRQLETMLAELPQHSLELEGLSKPPGETGKPSPPPFPLAGATLPSSSSLTMGPVHMASYDNANIPYPRTTGARFSKDGLTLVCFGRMAHQKHLKLESEKRASTPRSLASFDVDSEGQKEPHLAWKPSGVQITSNPYSSVGYSESNSNSLTRKGRFSITSGLPSEMLPSSATVNTNSLTKKGRFKVKRVRSGSTDEGRGLDSMGAASSNMIASKEQSPIVVVCSTGGTTTTISANTSFVTSSTSGANIGFFHLAPAFFSGLKCTQSPKVTVYDISKLQPYDRRLAESYQVWSRDPAQVCLQNCKLASECKRDDLAKLWMMCSKVAKLKGVTQDLPWAVHPLGKPLLKSILRHCIKMGDFQTSASILCTFWPFQKPSVLSPKPPTIIASRLSSLSNSAESSPIHLPQPATTALQSPSSSSRVNYLSVLDPKGKMKATGSGSSEKKTKFWFIKPEIMKSLGQSGNSPYHTIQLASLSSAQSKPKIPLRKPKSRKGVGLPYTTSDNNLELYGAFQKSHRSNSWGDACEEALNGNSLYSPANTIAEIGPNPTIHVKDVWPSKSISTDSIEEPSESTTESSLTVEPLPNQDALLDPELFATYERLKAIYADQLHIWGLWKQRLCVLKASSLVDKSNEDHDNLKLAADCLNQESGASVIDVTETTNHHENNQSCGTRANVSAQCRGCLRPSLYCVICLLPVRGLASGCPNCGHAGHAKHVKNWFMQNDLCPVPGCDCPCTAWAY